MFEERNPLVFSVWEQRCYSKCFITSTSRLCNWARVLEAFYLAMTDVILYFLDFGAVHKVLGEGPGGWGN